MRNIFAAFLFFCTFALNAQTTQVSGNQSGTWNGEIHLTDDVIVPNNEVLTVEPGTMVIADGYFGITVLGDFYALGDENARISFTVADTTGYSNYEDTEAGAWKGITFSQPGTVRLEYCDFSYGKTPVGGDGGAMKMYCARDVEISHCSFHHNTMRKRGGAMYAELSEMYIHDCEVYDNFGLGNLGSYCWGVGFQFLKCNLNIHDMVFHDNISYVAYGGGMNIDSCNMEMKNVVFYNNYAVDAAGLGIQRCKDYSVKVVNMLAYNNSVLHYGGGLAMATSDPELNNLTIVNNICGGGGGAGMQMAFNSCPTLNNCIFWGNHAYYTVEKDTVEYYLGSQIWVWGDNNYPTFRNGVLQYGLDTINCYPELTEEQYVDMLEIDPLLIDENNHDYHLSETSPCVNTGVADVSGMFLSYTDLDGNPRICGNRIDRGCYEFCYEDVSEVSTSEKQLVVYPNPLSDNALCVINLDRKTNVVLRLFSLDGKEIYWEDCGSLEAGENHISLEKMLNNIEKNNAMYILNIDNQYIKIVY